MAWRRRRPSGSPHDQFADEVVDLVGALLQLKARRLPNDFALEIVQRDGRSTTMNLQNIYAEACELQGDDRAARLRTAVLAMAPVPRPTTWDDAGPKLLPAVRAASWAAAGGPAGVLREPVAPFVSLLCAIDSEHAMTFATEADARAWGVDRHEAMERARANLAALPFEVGRDDSTAVFLGPDGYVSSWLAVPQALVRVAAGLGETVVALAAARDQLVLVNADDADATVQLLERTLADYQSAPRQLSPVPYLVRDDGVRVWDPPEAHPARPLVDRAAHILAAVEYSHQQAKLQDLLSKAGEDVFVAKYNLMQRQDESVYAWAAWVKQVTNALVPQADLLLLGDNDDPDAKFAVRWSDALDIAGAFLHQEDFEPPLWRYHGWPDAPTLAALRDKAVPFPPP